ncbi:MAG: outer membrane protein OmpA-like peptidoglycan-associated protein [Paracoccaceae bacterium]|jgi:outer membrane protein OmpA-like peptidoglycan-associated protein
MTRISKPILLFTATAFALTACTTPDGSPRPNTTGAAILGGLIGGVIGAGKGGNKKNNVILGAAIGATIGGLIGQELDRQEEALRASLGNGDIGIVNTGSELVVTLPESITFDTGSAEVRGALRSDLMILAQNLNDFPNTTIDVIGHTDNVGAASFNQQLSAQRADNVFIILNNSGVDSARLRAFGRGEDEPKASNLSEDGRTQNRRVEIIIRPIG